MLQNHISSHYSGDELHDTAISLAALDTPRKFHSSFVRPYTKGQSEKKHENLWQVMYFTTARDNHI